MNDFFLIEITAQSGLRSPDGLLLQEWYVQSPSNKVVYIYGVKLS